MKIQNIAALSAALLMVGNVNCQPLAKQDSATSGPLTIGSVAPALNVGGWAKGTPVTTFDPSKLYVVEFWATWCGPCKVSIPHLTELAKEYKGKITFTGVSVWEQDAAEKGATYASLVDKVKAFVKSEGDKMDYNVAYDNAYKKSDTSLASTWMAAAGQNGIPTAFVIKNDHIIWIGHPMTLKDPLAQITTGSYDEAAFKKTFDQKQEANLITMKIGSAMQAKDYKTAIALCTSAEQDHPEIGAEIQPMHYEALYMSQDTKGAADYLAANAANNPNIYIAALNLAMNYGKTADDKKSAISYAQAYLKAKGADQYEGLYYLANAYQANGDKANAIKTVKEAISKASKDKDGEGPQVLNTFKQLLTSFEGNQASTDSSGKGGS